MGLCDVGNHTRTERRCVGVKVATGALRAERGSNGDLAVCRRCCASIGPVEINSNHYCAPGKATIPAAVVR